MNLPPTSRLQALQSTRRARQMALWGWCDAAPILFLTRCLLWQFQGRTLPLEAWEGVERIRWSQFYDHLTQRLVTQLLGLLREADGWRWN